MISRAGGADPAAGRGDRFHHRGRAARRPPQRHHAPRREAGQRAGRRRRPGQAHRLRHRPQRRRRADDQRRPGARLAGLHRPGGGGGAAGDPAADLWGLGATLFAAIEGRPPYDVHGDPVRTITEVVDGAVPRPRVPGPVADVITALMVKDPDRRMALDEVRRRLRPLILDPDDPVYPGSPDAPTLASPIARPPTGGGGAAADRRPAAAARPSPSDTGPPSLVKSGSGGPPGSRRARPGPLPPGRHRASGSAAGAPPEVSPRPRPGTGSSGRPRVGSGTGGQPGWVARPISLRDPDRARPRRRPRWPPRPARCPPPSAPRRPRAGPPGRHRPASGPHRWPRARARCRPSLRRRRRGTRRTAGVGRGRQRLGGGRAGDRRRGGGAGRHRDRLGGHPHGGRRVAVEHGVGHHLGAGPAARTALSSPADQSASVTVPRTRSPDGATAVPRALFRSAVPAVVGSPMIAVDDRSPDATTAAAALAERTGIDRHDVAVVLGSGWRPAADVLGRPRTSCRWPSCPASWPRPWPGTAAPSGRCRSAGRRVLVLLGRTHLYEGHGPAAGGRTGCARRPRPAARRWC